jgi:hypothetical protein
MKRILCVTALLPLLLSGFGCAMCQNCFDDDYPAYGGICEDAGCGGRAGSIITPGHGETIIHEQLVPDGQMGPEQPQPTAAAPPLPEEAPLPDETPAESAEEGLSLEGFGVVPPPLESGTAPDLAPPSDIAPLPSDGESRLGPPLVPDNLPNFGGTPRLGE